MIYLVYTEKDNTLHVRNTMESKRDAETYNNVEYLGADVAGVYKFRETINTLKSSTHMFPIPNTYLRIER